MDGSQVSIAGLASKTLHYNKCCKSQYNSPYPSVRGTCRWITKKVQFLHTTLKGACNDTGTTVHVWCYQLINRSCDNRKVIGFIKSLSMSRSCCYLHNLVENVTTSKFCMLHYFWHYLMRFYSSKKMLGWVENSLRNEETLWQPEVKTKLPHSKITWLF